MKIVITGASSGIGAAVAAKCIAHNHEVINIDLKNSDKVKTYIGDISDFKKMEEIANKIDKIDVLICNAAYENVTDLSETNPIDFENVVKTNLCGTYNTIFAFLNKIAKDGQILNITSVHGEKPRLKKYAYDASKAGVNMLTKELALALADKNIRVNALALGATRTPMNAAVLNDKKLLKIVEGKIPLGRVAEPEEVADAAYSLLGKEFSYMTGTIVVFDGGRSLKD